MKGLCALKKERKEKVHSFTQRFASYLKNFSETDKPSDKVLIEYYTSGLGPELAMFAKIKAKPTLVKTYEEAEIIEVERDPNSQERKVWEGKTFCLLSLRKSSHQTLKVWKK